MRFDALQCNFLALIEGIEILFDHFGLAAETVDDRLLERAVEIHLVLAFEIVVDQNHGKSPQDHRVRAFVIADTVRGDVERIYAEHFFIFADVGTLHRRTVIQQNAVRLEFMDELFQSGLRHGDQQIAVAVDQRRRYLVVAQDDGAACGTSALFGAVGWHPRDVEITQFRHVRKHDAETQNPLPAEAADLDPALIVENLRLVAEGLRNPDIEFPRKQKLPDFFGVVNRRRRHRGERRRGHTPAENTSSCVLR